ncbi:hypothetical protein D0869_02473 [Hortaea werneckii]|uniref:Lipase n=1 Tax=Hortaea werneckii TaxID=91943 RepID=A0A3M6X9S3_HORWE|nr:secretory lipase-like protein 1 precursor [Hortaea werneckii]KAI7594095.1 secretory lipase-like protein 1 precursor [Hortaea werneckii]RMX87286.1 hypothetical protein D0869_02473 [Hortaea werneckii]RMY14059.1 hypothetical protein D0868_01669 [Hortaea werneckii]
MLSTTLQSLVLSALAVTSLALPSNLSSPLPPSKDAWYTAPTAFEQASPGDVLRLRQAPGDLTSIYNESAAAYNILYRSTDSKFEPTWDVTTLFVPKRTRGSALLSYQIPYNTAYLDGSPSYALNSPSFSSGHVLNDIQTALSMGAFVVVPDHEGPLAAFPLGVQEGHAILDSVRAVLRTGFGLAEDARYALWGYSGGSIASEWAAELQQQYAPELDFAGAAIGGVVSNVTALIDQSANTWWAGLVPAGLLGATAPYPAAREYLMSQLRSNGTHNETAFEAAESLTSTQAVGLFASQDIWTYFKDGKDVLQAPILRSILNSNGYMGYHGIPQMPLFVYKAIADELTPIADTDKLVQSYCDVGVNVVYKRNTVGGHLAGQTNGRSQAWSFLKSVLIGSYEPEGCIVENVAWNVTSSML